MVFRMARLVSTVYGLGMDELAKGKCVPCQGGVPPMTEKETAISKRQLDAEAPGWAVVNNHHLHRRWQFEDFQSALDFVNKVGTLAESQGHHPNIELGWGLVEITIWTHKINGLHQSDFVLAAKIDRIE